MSGFIHIDGCKEHFLVFGKRHPRDEIFEWIFYQDLPMEVDYRLLIFTLYDPLYDHYTPEDVANRLNISQETLRKYVKYDEQRQCEMFFVRAVLAAGRNGHDISNPNAIDNLWSLGWFGNIPRVSIHDIVKKYYLYLREDERYFKVIELQRGKVRQKPGRKPKFTLSVEDTREQILSGKTLSEIGAQYGVGQAAVSMFLSDRGVDVRDLKEKAGIRLAGRKKPEDWDERAKAIRGLATVKCKTTDEISKLTGFSQPRVASIMKEMGMPLRKDVKKNEEEFASRLMGKIESGVSFEEACYIIGICIKVGRNLIEKYYPDSHILKPSRAELAKFVESNGIPEAARHYGVSRAKISEWLVSYELPLSKMSKYGSQSSQMIVVGMKKHIGRISDRKTAIPAKKRRGRPKREKKEEEFWVLTHDKDGKPIYTRVR